VTKWSLRHFEKLDSTVEKMAWCVASCLLLISVSVWAVPMAPIEVTLSQPDGTQFQARPRGDEYAYWMETIEGYTIVQQDDEWFYATRTDDGRLAATSFSVGTWTPKELSTLSKHITPIIDSSLFERYIPLSVQKRAQKELRLYGTTGQFTCYPGRV